MNSAEREDRSFGATARALLKSSTAIRFRSSSTDSAHDARGNGNFGLRRFTEAQKGVFPRALREIQAGRKMTCWMWFIIPTPPYIVHGIEKGSSQNRKYALRSDEEGVAYLSFTHDGVNLRSNYFEIMSAVLEQLRSGRRISSLVGHFDGPKLASSAIFFERITRNTDEELHEVLAEVLEIANMQGGLGNS